MWGCISCSLRQINCSMAGLWLTSFKCQTCVCVSCSTWTCWRTAVEWGRAPFWFCSVTFVSISLDPQLGRAINWAGRVISFLWDRGNDSGDRCDDIIIALNTSFWVTMVTAYTHGLTTCMNAHINNVNCTQHKQAWDRTHMGRMCLQRRVETHRNSFCSSGHSWSWLIRLRFLREYC